MYSLSRRVASFPRSFQRSFSTDGPTLQKAFLRSVKGDMREERPKPRSPPPMRSDTTHSTHHSSSSPPSSQRSFSREIIQFTPKISVIGVGGGGCNSVNNMIERGLTGVDFICANSDAQQLINCLSEKKIQLGRESANGLGCGARPDRAIAAVEECRDEIIEAIGDSDLVFVTAGMGGGTGTGAAPYIAEICVDRGILTVAIVTKPFKFEGIKREMTAMKGLQCFENRCDALIMIPNEKLLSCAGQSASLTECFSLANDVVLAGIKSVTDIIYTHGFVNVDYADIREILAGTGNAIIGSGLASGENRAVLAAREAVLNPLMEDNLDLSSAKGIIIYVSGGKDITLMDVNNAITEIRSHLSNFDANIIFGQGEDPSLEGSIRVSLIAAGLEPKSRS